MFMDNECNKVADELPQFIINTTATNEHMGEVEQHISLIKEHVQGIMATLSFKSIPKIMVIHLIHHSTCGSMHSQLNWASPAHDA